jgi:hypothetical protein
LPGVNTTSGNILTLKLKKTYLLIAFEDYKNLRIYTTMKRVVLSFIYTSIIITILLIFSRCNFKENEVYLRLRKHADQIKVINTHEHQRRPEEWGGNHHFRFYHLMALSAYLISDLNSAGANGYDFNKLDSLSLDELWVLYGKYLDFSRNTSYYGQFAKGFQKLYDFNNLFFTRENLGILSAQIEKNYKDYNSWFDKAFHKAEFQLMFNDQFWNRYNTDIDERYYALVFPINSLISFSSQKPGKGTELKSASIYKEAEREGYEISTLDDYLKFCDHLFKKNVEKKAVCLKNSQAYSRTLYYEDVPYDEAQILFDKSSIQLIPIEAKKLQDFMFHWIIQKSIQYDLPIQIHTGYLSGNGNVLDNGEPIKLNNLFLKYPKAKFILFHGGFPWTGECAALGKMFPNVYLDLVWLPQISREEAIYTLDVMLDCVPYNKFFWGGDCQLIEESVGSLEFGKDVVAEVLSKRVKRGLLTEELALKIADRIFRENAIEVFSLEERLGREL